MTKNKAQTTLTVAQQCKSTQKHKKHKNEILTVQIASQMHTTATYKGRQWAKISCFGQLVLYIHNTLWKENRFGQARVVGFVKFEIMTARLCCRVLLEKVVQFKYCKAKNDFITPYQVTAQVRQF